MRFLPIVIFVVLIVMIGYFTHPDASAAVWWWVGSAFVFLVAGYMFGYQQGRADTRAAVEEIARRLLDQKKGPRTVENGDGPRAKFSDAENDRLDTL